MNRLSRSPARRVSILATSLGVAAALLFALGLALGSTGWTGPAALSADPALGTIVWEIRAPRSLGALLAGALLGLAGTIAQGLFRNPLADPYLLGSASGAALGVAAALVAFGGSSLAVASVVSAAALGLTGAAFAGALAAVALTIALAGRAAGGLRLLLAGVVVGVVAAAAREMLTLAAPEVLQAMQSFMLGSTGFVGWSGCAAMAVALVVALGVAVTFSRTLDGLALGESTAASLGLAAPGLRLALVAAMALATGAAVAQTGLVAFVGLAAPHLVRPLARTTHAPLAVLGALAGAVLLAAADLLARSLLAPQELPVGVLTGLVGGAYLLWMLRRGGDAVGADRA